MRILYYIAQNIPENVWLTNVVLKGDTFTLEGESSDYPSVGLFWENLKICNKNAIKRENSTPPVVFSSL